MKTKLALTIAICMVVSTYLFSQPIFPLEGYEDNPILEVTLSWETGGLMFPFIHYEDGTFYLLYTGGDMWTGPTSIGLATSTDGYNFTKLEEPIFEGDGSGFDAYSVCLPVIFKKDDTYYLFYAGASSGGFCSDGFTGQAMATDILGPYERLTDPILEPGSAGEWDGSGVAADRVFDSDSGLVMYFSGSASSSAPQREGFAFFNGSEWIKYDDPSTTNHPYAESDPILNYGTPPAWDSHCASFVDVHQITTGWELFYQGQYNGNWKIGYATSVNGMVWIKNEDPVYSWADDLFAQMWGFTITASPTMVVVGNKYFIYYDYGNCYNYLGMATAWSINALDVVAEYPEDITTSSFSAKWQPSQIGIGFLLDVSYDENFTEFVDGYENLDVGNVTMYPVSDLTSFTPYYYRLRSYMETDTGFYSNTILALTTGLKNINKDGIQIWSSGNEVFVDLQDIPQPDDIVRIYSITGQMVSSLQLNEKRNSIPVYVDSQLLIIQVQTENQIVTKKVLVW